MSDVEGGSPDAEVDIAPPGSRYATVSRRAFLTRTAGLGAAVVAVVACGHNDAEVFARGPATSSGSGGAAGSTAVPTTAPTTTAPRSSTPSASSTSTASPSTTAATTTPPTTNGSAAPTGDMAVRFTYRTSSAGGRVNNPYVAVWVEDAGGELVDTLGLWYLKNQKGARWLNELRRWSSVDGSQDTLDTVSSATRTPGDHALVWKLTDSEDRPVPAGDYFICIEAAREHGPYSLIRQPFTLGAAPFKTDLPAQGELTNASIAHPAG